MENYPKVLAFLSTLYILAQSRKNAFPSSIIKTVYHWWAILYIPWNGFFVKLRSIPWETLIWMYSNTHLSSRETVPLSYVFTSCHCVPVQDNESHIMASWSKVNQYTMHQYLYIVIFCIACRVVTKLNLLHT